MRKEEGGSGWRCVAVTSDPRNADRIRITCRDEDELARVKGVADIFAIAAFSTFVN